MAEQKGRYAWQVRLAGRLPAGCRLGGGGGGTTSVAARGVLQWRAPVPHPASGRISMWCLSRGASPLLYYFTPLRTWGCGSATACVEHGVEMRCESTSRLHEHTAQTTVPSNQRARRPGVTAQISVNVCLCDCVMIEREQHQQRTGEHKDCKWLSAWKLALKPLKTSKTFAPAAGLSLCLWRGACPCAAGPPVLSVHSHSHWGTMSMTQARANAGIVRYM